MIGEKVELDTERDSGGVAEVPDSGDGGLGVNGEWKEVADMNFFGVRSSINIEIRQYTKHLKVYVTVKEGKLVAAIIYDVFRLSVDLSYPEDSLNIRSVEICIQREIQKAAQKEARIELAPIGKTFLVEFMKRHSVKLSDDSPDAHFPLKLEGLDKKNFGVLKEKISNLGRQCFQELKDKITREYAIQGRKRTDFIPPSLTDVRIQALKVQFAKLVAELAPSNGNSMEDAKSGAVRNDFITHFRVELRKLESALYLEDGALLYNRYMPQA